MDLATSLLQTAAGYDVVFTVVDRFSKLVKLYLVQALLVLLN